MIRIFLLAGLAFGLCWVLHPLHAAPQKMAPIQGWGTPIDPDGDCKFAEKKGKLIIRIPNLPHDFTIREDFANQNGPRVLQEVTGDFTVEVRVKSFPLPEKNTSAAGGRFSFVGAGLLIWQDNRNFIRLERSAEGNAGQLFVWMERFEDGKSVARKQTSIPDQDVSLQVERKGGKLAFGFKTGGDQQQWKIVQTLDVNLSKTLQVGVHGINTTTKVFAPQLEDLKLATK
jgi:regulation of enolase protein 1 (concanavalin A-like superfamily)